MYTYIIKNTVDTITRKQIQAHARFPTIHILQATALLVYAALTRDYTPCTIVTGEGLPAGGHKVASVASGNVNTVGCGVHFNASEANARLVAVALFAGTGGCEC